MYENAMEIYKLDETHARLLLYDRSHRKQVIAEALQMHEDAMAEYSRIMEAVKHTEDSDELNKLYDELDKSSNLSKISNYVLNFVNKMNLSM